MDSRLRGNDISRINQPSPTNGSNPRPYTRHYPTRANVPGTLAGMDLTELSRRLENLLRIGTVHSVDHGQARCRVQSGELVTQWLPWIERRAGQTTTWNPPTIGEQCMVLSPSGEPAGGVVIYGTYSAANAAPSESPDEHVTLYPDGTRISYDHVKGHHQASYPDGAHISYDHPSSSLEAVGIKTALVKASTSVTLDTPLTHITGQCVVDDLLTYKNGLAGTGGGNGSKIKGLIEHEGTHTQTGGPLSSNGVVLHTHTHTDVEPGPSNTGGPT